MPEASEFMHVRYVGRVIYNKTFFIKKRDNLRPATFLYCQVVINEPYEFEE